MDNADGARCRIMILGDRDVGKTTLRFKFVTNGFVQCIDPTDDLRRRHVMIDDKETLVEFSDIDVIRSHPAFRGALVRDSEAAILVYDVTSRRSFDYIESIYDQIMSTKGLKKDLRVKPFTFCIVGNKTDCSPARQVGPVEGEKLAASLGCHFFETSAVKMENVEEILCDLVREIRMQRLLIPHSKASGSRSILGGIEDILCARK